MEQSKCIKKSTPGQLQALGEHMEQNPEFARGLFVFGSSRMSLEEQWKLLTTKLNAMGPPLRSVVEWKKTWADLKSRTKKKVAENKKNMNATGGGPYRMNQLSSIEEIVDRTLSLSKSAAPSGDVFGYSEAHCSQTIDSIDDCFIALTDSPPKTSKPVAVITPTRQHQNKGTEKNQPQQQTQQQKSFEGNVENVFLPSSSKKKKVLVAGNQHALISQQLAASEKLASTSQEQVEATKNLVVAVNRVAEAVEKQSEIQLKMLQAIEILANNLKCLKQPK